MAGFGPPSDGKATAELVANKSLALSIVKCTVLLEEPLVFVAERLAGEDGQ